MTPELKRRIRPWRDRIDVLDERLVELLNERATCALRIGEMKRKEGVPIYDPHRESEILERVTRQGNGPLRPEALRRLFERILDESRSQERTGTEADDTRRNRRQ